MLNVSITTREHTMSKVTLPIALILSGLLLNSAVASTASHFPRQALWRRQMINVLLVAVTQDSPGNSSEEQFLNAVSVGKDVDVRRMLEEKPELAMAKDKRGISALMLAIYGQRASAVNAILARRKDDLSVFEASALGRDDILRPLLQRDRTLSAEFAPDGFTALHLASYFGHPSAQNLLIHAGADINAYSRNNLHASPLQSAAAASQLDAARVLLTNGANPNCRGEGGYSPLHEAAATGQLELVRLLLQYKADVTAKADDGKTPADVATQKKESAVLDLLKKGIE